jgi:hypothetical protein
VWIVGGLVLVAVVVAVILVLLPSGEQDRSATVVETVNQVDAHPRPRDDWQPATVGLEIYGGGRVRTGAASSARLELLEGIVRLFADSVFTVKESVSRQGGLMTTLFLQAGRLWAHLTTGQSHEFTVETGGAVVAVRDTLFSVQVVGDTALVSVAEGEATLAAQGQMVTVRAGEQAVVEGDKPPSLPEPMSDEERAWWATEGEMPQLAPPTPTSLPTSTPLPTPTPTPVDTTPPVVVSTNPPNGATNVSRNLMSVSITFNEPMRNAWDLSSWGFPTSAETQVSYDPDTFTFTFTRVTTEPLEPRSTMTLTLNLNEPPGFGDVADNEAPTYTFTFVTGE